MEKDLLWWVALNLVPAIGPVKAGRLLDHFGSPEAVFRAGRRDLQAVSGLWASDVEAVAGFNPAAAESELRLAEKHQFKLLTREEPGYPAPLKNIADPPILLYLKGEITAEDHPACAIVGTRICSPYGRVQAERFASALAAYQVTVVSGLARGVDTAAHLGALRGRGRTLAVLGSGLLNIYPEENRPLADRIASSGAVISEFPLSVRPDKGTFPRRNRLISGLSGGVLIVEAGQRSGALITTDYALEQGREVFALPGPVDQETSTGTNRLIADGARPALVPEDIVSVLVPNRLTPAAPAAGTETAGLPFDDELTGRLLTALSSEKPLTLDGLAALLGVAPARLADLLTRLELAGRVRALPGQRYRLP